MSTTLTDVLHEVEGRVGYLRAGAGADTAEGWTPCDALDRATLEAAVAAGAGARRSTLRVAASLLSQSYAFRVGAVSLAAYAVGLPWPSPAAADTAVTLAGGRASKLAYRSAALGEAGDVDGLAEALLGRHLEPFAGALRATVRLGERLVAGNVAGSCAAAFRAVEGAARDRGDGAERASIRRRAEAFFAAPRARRWLEGAGRFERVTSASPDPSQGGGAVDGWYWTRSSCCLWYQAPGSSTCDDCSLIPAGELLRRRLDELTPDRKARA